MGSRHGPDVIIIHRGINGDVDTVMFIETEIGHDLGGAKRYFETLSRRLRPIIERYRTEYGDSILFKNHRYNNKYPEKTYSLPSREQGEIRSPTRLPTRRRTEHIHRTRTAT